MNTPPDAAADAPKHFHDHEVVVQPADIDLNHHANNIVYLRWVQEAATAHWEKAVSREIAAGYSWVVVRHEIDYKKPAKLGEGLRVRTWVSTMSAVVSERRCQIWRDADNALLVETKTLWCAVHPETGRPKRIDPRIPEALLG
jgi:acyl-CoA thioester hydrolase